MVLTKTLVTRKAREIQARINRQLDLWKRGIHIGLVEYVLMEGRSQEGHIKRCVEDD